MSRRRIVCEPVRLSTECYATLWQYDNLGPMHTALLAETTLRDDEEQRTDEERAFGELRECGLLAGNSPHPDLRGSFELIRHAADEFYGYYLPGEQAEFTALVARAGDTALLAMLDAEGLSLRPVPPDSPAQVLGGLLPECQPMRISDINVPLEDLAAGGNRNDGTFLDHSQPGVCDGVAQLRGIFSSPQRAEAQFYVAARLDNGTRVRCPGPFGVLDFPAGRIMMRRDGDNPRNPLVSVMPGGPQVFIRAIEQLRSHLP
ncbi:MAG: ESX secretion-associated protein EspG [Sciscionella sp.]